MSDCKHIVIFLARTGGHYCENCGEQFIPWDAKPPAEWFDAKRKEKLINEMYNAEDRVKLLGEDTEKCVHKWNIGGLFIWCRKCLKRDYDSELKYLVCKPHGKKLCDECQSKPPEPEGKTDTLKACEEYEKSGKMKLYPTMEKMLEAMEECDHDNENLSCQFDDRVECAHCGKTWMPTPNLTPELDKQYETKVDHHREYCMHNFHYEHCPADFCQAAWNKIRADQQPKPERDTYTMAEMNKLIDLRTQIFNSQLKEIQSENLKFRREILNKLAEEATLKHLDGQKFRAEWTKELKAKH